jgi:hypothetical protein
VLAAAGGTCAGCFCAAGTCCSLISLRRDFLKEPRALLYSLCTHTRIRRRFVFHSLGAHMLEAKDTPGPPTCTRHALYAFPLHVLPCKNADQSMRTLALIAQVLFPHL